MNEILFKGNLIKLHGAHDLGDSVLKGSMRKNSETSHWRTFLSRLKCLPG